MSRAKRVCCVIGCTNSENKNPELQFYRFPGKSYEHERRLKWINAVRRLNENNQIWLPSESSRICSVHFEGGEKSENPLKTSYNPTIFPSIYKKVTSQNTLERTNRLIERNKKKSLSSNDLPCKIAKSTVEFPVNDIEEYETDYVLGEHSKCLQVDASTQTIPTDIDSNENISLLFCSQHGNDVSTQTSIFISNVSKTHKVMISESELEATIPRVLKNASSGPDSNMHVNFTGFSSVSCDQIMKSLGGISLHYFHILLTFIRPGVDGQPRYFKQLCKEDRLLLFLMKMKLGLSFSALGCIFQVSSPTVSTIFFSVLKTLCINAIKEKWLFWPSKEAIKETLPESFKNHPNCRVIIDCTELHCDTPRTVEQRILMYSSYKGGFTLKFLIGISPTGLITFLSKSYGGRSTDGFIVNDSGFLNYLEPGDEVMADKGFPTIKTDMLERKCVLVMPPFAWNPQFTQEEVLEGYAISSLRIHVERAIQRIKIFKILQHVSVELFPYINEIMFLACIFANDKEPLIKYEI